MALTSFSTWEDNKTGYFDIPLDSNLFTGGLKEPEVGKEVIIVFGFPVDFSQVDFSRVYDVKDLTIDWARAEGLDFGDIDLNEEIVTWRRALIQARISDLGTK